MNRIMLVLKTSKQAMMIKRRMRVNLVDNSRIWRDGFTVCINNDDDLIKEHISGKIDLGNRGRQYECGGNIDGFTVIP